METSLENIMAKEETEEEKAPEKNVGVFKNLRSGTGVIEFSDDECDKKVYCCNMANMVEEPPLDAEVSVAEPKPVEKKRTPELQRLMALERSTHGLNE